MYAPPEIEDRRTVTGMLISPGDGNGNGPSHS